VAGAGGRTQVGALAAAAVVVVLVPFADILRDVPLSALGAVLIVVGVQLFDLHGLVSVARFDVWEFALAAVTLLVVVLVGVEQGILVAVLLAMLDRVRLSARPQVHVLGRVPGTTSWTPPTAESGAVPVPGVLVAMFATPIWYANAVHFREEITAALSRSDQPVRTLVLDTIGMSDVDFTGTRALSEVLTFCEHGRITVGIARAGSHLVASLRRGGLAARIGADHFYATVDEAVRALDPGGTSPA
jgi:MFS superfamily sulfate permease-like transporter